MRKMLMKAGAIGFALAVLGLLMVHAGASSGCSKSQTAKPAQAPAAEPPITTKASEAPTAQPKKYEVYGPATKAGPILYAPNRAPQPPQQQSKP